MELFSDDKRIGGKVLDKKITDYTGEELAELLSGEHQRITNVYGVIIDSINVLHLVQNELEKRKLKKRE